MIEEEYELSSEFNTNNMTRLAILKAESIYQDRMNAINEGRDDTSVILVGEAFYQPHKNFE